MNRADLRAALSNANVQAFARVVREGESGQSERAYFMRYGGMGNPPAYFDSLLDHPRVFEPTVGGKRSSAAGAYQATATTWDEERRKYDWPDFSPGCQDEFFVARLLYRGAIKAVMDGNLEEACRLCAKEWTSLPGGSEENAATARARETYLKWGGYLSAAPVEDTLSTEHYGETVTESVINPVPSADEQEARMSPFILPALELAAKYLPALAEHFSSGSKSAVRNIAAGKVIADAITEATQSPNIQAAVEKLERREPEATAAAKSAVADVLPMLVEAGGGGIKGAREAAEAQSGDWRKLIFSLPFVGLVVFTPAIWAVVAAAVFKAPWLLELDAQLRGTVIGFVMGTLAGSICGYIFGSSMTKAPVQSLSRG